MAVVSLEHVNAEAFGRDLDQLRRDIDGDIGDSDVQHLRRFEIAGRLSSILGLATAWIVVNPLSAFLLSLGAFVRWGVFMHHIGHRAYDRIPGAPARYRSSNFGRGWRRFVDWPDWSTPEAWMHEHNTLHHTRTNEDADPDFVQRNIVWFRKLPGGRIWRYASVIFIACTWRLSYLVPSTTRALQLAKRRRAGQPSTDDSPQGLLHFYDYGDPEAHRQWAEMTDPRGARGREFWLGAVLPYAISRFVILPGLFLPLGWHAAFSVLGNVLLAEVFTNIHSFATIVTNHAGADLPRFDEPAKGRSEFFLHQAAGAVNFPSPGIWSDFLYGGLNFHIEHHLWPDLPLAKYRQIAPRVREICERHGVPYREESVVKRVWRLTELFLGETQEPARMPDKARPSIAA